MKLNWGHYILITIILFVGLILYMVVRSFQFDNELVSEDYYEKELRYQEVIEKRGRASKLSQNITWASAAEGIVIHYPKEFLNITGSIYLFRPSDKSLDLELPIKADTSFQQVIPISEIQAGKYLLQIDWNSNDKGFFTEGVVFVSK